MKDFYKNWDNFDVEGPQDSSDEEKKPKPQPEPSNPMQLTSGALPGTKLLVKGGRNAFSKAERLKDQGNLSYQQLNFEQAENYYSEAIQAILDEEKGDNEMLVILYSNRAQANIKLRKFKEAELDCTNALSLDFAHIKSLWRRAVARSSMQQ